MAARVARTAAGLVLLAGTALAVPAASPAAATGTADTYLVLYRSSTAPSDAAQRVAQAGGSVVAVYDQIGVVVARSSSSGFSAAIARDSRVDGVSPTARYASRLDDGTTAGSRTDADGPPPGDDPGAPATDSDTFSGLQWDMRQVHAPEAHAVTGGSPVVVVGDIDTGTDYRHPDLRANIDDGRSANCVSGAAVPGAAPADDDHGHGTHTAGIIAAAANGVGIVGVAPQVKIASIKAGNADGYFFPEAVVCAFMWAGQQHVDVTNNSYFADPYLYNCRNEAGQRAIWKAEQRAIRFAMQQGVTVVAAEGNESDDLSHPTQDVSSPDDGTPVTRDVSNACLVVPVEVPGVVGVTASGSTAQGTSAGQYPDHLKSFYSSYGVSSADVVAPGGDSIFFTPESVNGRVLSTWPANRPCTRNRQEPTDDPAYPTAVYCYLQGTSMASPHVAGVAALIVSLFGDGSTPQNGRMRPEQVAALLQQTADPQDCPRTLPDGYARFTSASNGAVQSCTGGSGHTSWYGSGELDALAAVTHRPGA